MTATARTAVDRVQGPEVRDVASTTCVVVGGGPAGAVLALLLARQGVAVTLLESHSDFDREFRGDTLHPSALEVLDELGLADRLHAVPHTKVSTIPIEVPEGPLLPVDLRALRSPYPYIMLVHQARFLRFITDEAARYPTFRLIMSANVRRLIVEGGVTRGVRYRSPDGWHEVRAGLVVAADGRHSKVRALAGVAPITTPSPMDVLWFRLPRLGGDPGGSFARIARGRFVGVLRREDHWQALYTIPKGAYPQLRGAGLPALRASLAEVLPAFSPHLEYLTDWKQLALLSVEANRLRRWWQPGLLFIGDAAHSMSPAGGVGINLAIADAVVAANELTRPLLAWQREGRPVRGRHLSAVQRRRELPTRLMQALQRAEERSIAAALAGRRALSPLALRLLRLPVVRNLLARVIGLGLWRVRPRLRGPRPAGVGGAAG